MNSKLDTPLIKCVNCGIKVDLKKDKKSLIIHAKVANDDERLFYVCGVCSVYVPGANEPK
jgi:3-deoxy-D-arabino-heptulosonate 7-phosphate (DAHP) synthase